MVLEDMVFEALQDMRCCDRLSSLMMEAASSRAGIASSDANTQAHINVWSPSHANIIAAEADRKTGRRAKANPQRARARVCLRMWLPCSS